MFQFPWFASMDLCIRPSMTGLHPGRVSPFGYPWINARLQLPMAFRSLPRPSSPSCAQASTSRPSSLDPLIKPSLLSHATTRARSRQEKTHKPAKSPLRPPHALLLLSALLGTSSLPSSLSKSSPLASERAEDINRRFGPSQRGSNRRFSGPGRLIPRADRPGVSGPAARVAQGAAASAASASARSSTGSRSARRSAGVGASSTFGSIPTPSNCEPSGK